MNQTTQFASEILDTSAPAYAGYAASLLVERHPDIFERSGRSAMRQWKAYLTAQIQELAAALAVEEPSLFAARVRWEDQAFRAREDSNEDLVAALESLGDVLAEELPSHARETVKTYLEPARLALSRVQDPPRIDLDANDTKRLLMLRYIEAVLEGNSRRALDLVSAARLNGMSVRDLYLDVLLAAQRQVGQLWHLGELTIAEEHVVTATTERAMAILAQGAPRAADVGKTIVTGAVAGNMHGLGVRVLADFFERAGWRTICLGPDLPPAEMAAAMVHFDADVAALSATLSTHLKMVTETVSAIRALTTHDVQILVGGGAFAESPHLWERLGADGYAESVDDALTTAARLVGLTPAGH